MSNYIKVKLGGKERGLKYNMGALRHLGEITQSDPLDFTNVADPLKQFDFVKSIVHAGLLANADSKKSEPDFNEKEVIEWVSELSAQEAAIITSAFAKAYAVGGEAKTDTQS